MKNSQLNQCLLFSAVAPIVYFIADLYRLPMFTFFPAVNEFYWGWAPMSNDLGPGMYWYGWLATATAFSGLLSMVITRLIPEKSHFWTLLLQYLWILPIALLIPLVVSLKFYWR